MTRMCNVVLACLATVVAVGCEPSAEDDEVSLPSGVSIEAPTESRQQSDYNKYAEEVCVKSPVGQNAETAEPAKKD